MGRIANLFYDTYALIEFISGSQIYKKYFLQESGLTTRSNLMELYYKLLKEHGEEKAELAYDSFLGIAIDISDNTIKEAMKLRLSLKQNGRDISYTDAIGYALSLEKGLKFLTGDSEFKGLKNVEFVR